MVTRTKPRVAILQFLADEGFQLNVRLHRPVNLCRKGLRQGVLNTYDEREWPHEGACLRYNMNRSRQVRWACLRYMMNRNRHTRGRA